jgi:hypothetical protein
MLPEVDSHPFERAPPREFEVCSSGSRMAPVPVIGCRYAGRSSPEHLHRLGGPISRMVGWGPTGLGRGTRASA